jgi:hypothetical protein
MFSIVSNTVDLQLRSISSLHLHFITSSSVYVPSYQVMQKESVIYSSFPVIHHAYYIYLAWGYCLSGVHFVSWNFRWLSLIHSTLFFHLCYLLAPRSLYCSVVSIQCRVMYMIVHYVYLLKDYHPLMILSLNAYSFLFHCDFWNWN